MSIKLRGSSDGSVTLQAPADTSPSGSDKTFTLPTADGSNGQIIQTNGSGALSFTSLPAGSVTGNTFFYVYDNSGTAGTSSYVALGNASSNVQVFENVGSDYDNTTNRGRYTAPADGLYRFVMQTELNSVGSGLLIKFQFYKNGSAFQRQFATGDALNSFNNNGDPTAQHNMITTCELVATLSANDYIEARLKLTGTPKTGQSSHFDRRGLFLGYRLN